MMTWDAFSHTKAILARIPPERPFRLAEVGVLEAANSVRLLTERALLFIVCVDLWQPYPAWSCQRDPTARPHDWAAVRRTAEAALAPFSDRITIHAVDSADAAALEADASCDGVYLDAHHEEPYVSRDIEIWRRKVKPGGWIGGHDYTRRHPNWTTDPDPDPETTVDISPIVDRLAALHGWTVDHVGDINWFVTL
jgi:hypothetical protein